MKYRLVLALVSFVILGNGFSVRAQYGYSDFVDSLIAGVTDSSLSLLNRQLSGDTSVFIGGLLDTIKSRHDSNPGNAKAAQYILEKFQSFGLPAEYQQYDNDGYNVVATKTGSIYPNEYYIVCAHYDDQPVGPLAPGADDNASGTAAVMEAARIMSAFNFDYTVKFITFDEEEQGLWGSWAYSDTAAKYGHIIKGVLNLDMIGYDSNNDYEMSISTNNPSMPLLVSFTDILRIYQPQLSPHQIIATNSDHSRFWNNGYQALLAIEEYPGDFTPNYHSTNDLFQNLNLLFFLSVAKGATAALATMARNYRMNLGHQQITNNCNTGDRIAKIVITSPHPIDNGIFKPRLYYKLDDNSFSFLNAFQISGDTFKFTIPGQAQGTKISYYFAAQDMDGEFAVTLPESGKGVNPPGSVAPPVFFSYYILNSTTTTICATGLPMSIPGNQIVYKSITVPNAGRLLDVNVNLSISHSNDKDINLYLVSPSGREVMLSTKNGFALAHYTNTTFNDEGVTFINQGRPPYTGTFRPEQPLSLFDDTVTNGNWQLKIRNAGGTAGSLTQFCLVLTYAGSDYYVDASRPVSGNGRSWATAFRTISEASNLDPPAGSVVLIKPGTYNEDITITSNGEEKVALRTGVAISEGNKIQFPTGTNLSGIDLVNHPGEYFAYVARSRNFNNGCYQISQVSDAGDFIRVNEQYFRDETGSPGDSTVLSASVGRPVIYRKYAVNPETERVIADASDHEEIRQVLYIGDAIGDGADDAFPANYNILEGIDLTGAMNGGGVHIQSSSFNVISGSRIYENRGTGALIKGNNDHPSFYNFIINNDIRNTPYEAVCIGSNGMSESFNHSYYNHIIGNNIQIDESFLYDEFEHAVVIRENNRGTLIERNFIHDFSMISPEKGALDIMPGTDHTLVNANIFKNVGKTGDGANALIMVQGYSEKIEIFNNILYNSLPFDDDIYAFRINGTGHANSKVLHNTIYNIDRGFLLEDFGDPPAFKLANNIIHINDVYFTHSGSEGRFQVSYNLYPTDPTPEPGMPYYGETGRQVGHISFQDPSSGNFNLLIGDEPAIITGMSLSPPVQYDANQSLRSTELSDIGALELQNKITWTGLINQNWSTTGNWNLNALPGSISNVVIKPAPFSPKLDLNHVIVKGLLLKQGATLQVLQDKILELSE